MAGSKVKLDLNNSEFLNCLFELEKDEKLRVIDTLSKISLEWSQVYSDKGLRWEKIFSIKPPKGIDALYSIRMTQSARALAYRQEDFMRFLLVSSDHDAAYGKK